MQVITDPASFEIQPQDLKPAPKQLFNCFGSYEAEVSAAWILAFCQSRNSWASFTVQELNAFSAHTFCFNGLDSKGYIEIRNDVCYLTEEFVKQIAKKYKL